MCDETDKITIDLRKYNAEQKLPVLGLVEIYRQLEKEHRQLRAAIYRARTYAGDNLPASKGLTIVAMLEKALKGETL